MKLRPLSIDGAWEVTPQQHADPRGLFLEWYRNDRLAEAVGHPLAWAQGNLSVSARGVVRGIHYADVPPGQAKYVTCVRGAVFDVVVDLRRGSPTFGEWEAVELDDVHGHQLWIPVGFGHGFCVLSETADFVYKCTNYYDAATESGIRFDDPEVGIEWPADIELLYSERDRNAPRLAEVADSLPFAV